MRTELEKINERRTRFSATFERRGLKSAYRGLPTVTLLFTGVTDAQGKPVCDHLWLNLTKAFAALDLQPGDRIEFHARVKQYQKGYRGRREDVLDAPIETDYKLSHPTQIRKVAP
ncbi:MAG: hypothetical protein ABI835_16900 [Chloroflexota bacterium]